MLVSAPEGYQKIHREYALKGARVLALAYKFMPSMSIKAIKDLDREKAECDLIFAGFLSARCIPIFTARRSDVAVETASPDVP